MSSLVVVIEWWIYCLPHNEESLVSMLFGTFIHTLFNFKIVFIFVFVSIFNEGDSKDPGNYSGITFFFFFFFSYNNFATMQGYMNSNANMIMHPDRSSII